MAQGRTRLDHMVIHVSDWQTSNAFYRDVLGVKVVPQGRGWVYQLGEMRFNVHGPGVDPDPVARIPVPPGGSDFCLEWAGPIAEAEAHLERHGVIVELGPVAREGARGAGKSVYFRDPDGSLLEFIAYGERGDVHKGIKLPCGVGPHPQPPPRGSPAQCAGRGEG